MSEHKPYTLSDYCTCVILAPLAVFPMSACAAIVAAIVAVIAGFVFTPSWENPGIFVVIGEMIVFVIIIGGALSGSISYAAAHILSAAVLAIALPVTNRLKLKVRKVPSVIVGGISALVFSAYMQFHWPTDNWQTYWLMYVGGIFLNGATVGYFCFRLLRRPDQQSTLQTAHDIDIDPPESQSHTFDWFPSAAMSSFIAIPILLGSFVLFSDLITTMHPDDLGWVVILIAAAFIPVSYIYAIIIASLLLATVIMHILSRVINNARTLWLSYLVVSASLPFTALVAAQRYMDDEVIAKVWIATFAFCGLVVGSVYTIQWIKWHQQIGLDRPPRTPRTSL